MKNILKKSLLVFGVIGCFTLFTKSQVANASSMIQPEYDFSGWCENPGQGCIHIELDTVVIKA